MLLLMLLLLLLRYCYTVTTLWCIDSRLVLQEEVIRISAVTTS
jgi:hypothetical protein